MLTSRHVSIQDWRIPRYPADTAMPSLEAKPTPQAHTVHAVLLNDAFHLWIRCEGSRRMQFPMPYRGGAGDRIKPILLAQKVNTLGDPWVIKHGICGDDRILCYLCRLTIYN